MRESVSMRRKGLPQLGGWIALPAVALGLLLVLAIVVRTSVAQGYDLWPPSMNALALLQVHLRRLSVIWALLLILVALPLRVWGGDAERRLRIAWVWAAAIVVPGWAYWGLQFNRFEVAGLWRSSVQLGSVEVPAALTSGRVWAINAALTVGALVAAWLLARLWGLCLPLLATYRAPRWWSRSTLVFLVLGLLVAWAPRSLVRPTPAGGDVILISLDAFRADRMRAFGGDGAWTPRLDEFAGDARVYTHAYCQEPWTLTSHMSMLSGLYPDTHGLDFGRSLPAAIWTLPERLRDAGWRTLGSVYDCLFLEPRFGYGDGFDHYEVNRSPAAIRARHMARRIEGGGPAFVFLHFYDPHSDRGSLPYESRPETRARVAPDAAARFEGWSGAAGASEMLVEINEGRAQLDSTRRHALEQLYDAGVADTDAAVGEFLDSLRREGRYEDALILVVADHGEALGETSRGHPHFMHEELMEETLRIPLLVKLPGGGAAVDDRIAETVDLLPTVCDVLGLPLPEIVQGRSLVDAAPERQFSFARSGELYSITDAHGRRLRYRWDEKFGVQFESGTDADPELRRVATAAIDRFHRGNRALASRFGGGEVELSEADEALLRSLGYVK